MSGKGPIVMGPFPDPRHGQAVVTAAAADLIDDVTRIDISSGGLSGTSADMVAKLGRLGIGLLALVRQIRSAPVLYIAADSGEGMYANAVMVAIARLSGTPVVLQHHTEFYLDEPRRAMAFIQRLGGAKLVNALLCQCSAERFSATYSVADDRVTVIGNAFSVPHSAEVDRPGRPTTFGHLANLSKAKGIQDVVRLARSHPDVTFIVAGPVVDDVAAEAVAVLEGLANVEVLGQLDGDEVQRFHQRCDVFLLPSETEAMPLVVWEALSAGATVLAYDVGCVRSMGGEDSIVVVEGPAQLDQMVKELVTGLDAQTAEQWAESRAANRATFSSRFAADRDRLIEVMDEVGGG